MTNQDARIVLIRERLQLFRCFRLATELRLFESQLVGDVVLVDVADIRHRLLSDVFGRNKFHIVEPDVRVKAHICCLFAQPRDTIRSGIITGKDEQTFYLSIDLGIVKVRICDVAQHLGAGMNVSFASARSKC